MAGLEMDDLPRLRAAHMAGLEVELTPVVPFQQSVPETDDGRTGRVASLEAHIEAQAGLRHLLIEVSGSP